MIYRNAVVHDDVAWIGALDPQAGEIVRDFLAGECDLMKLAGARPGAIADLQIFLNCARGKTICVERSQASHLLVRAVGSSESLLLTGRTAEVVCAYLDQAPVMMEDRSEMTIRRYRPFRLLSN